jgi:hypothetical protein
MTSIEALLEENQQLKVALHQVQIARAATERKYILRDSHLPEPCVKRLDAAFTNSTDNAGLKQAIHAEERFLERAR